MPIRRRGRRRRAPVLTLARVLDLMVGPMPSWSTFADDAEARAFWQYYRLELIALQEELATGTWMAYDMFEGGNDDRD